MSIPLLICHGALGASDQFSNLESALNYPGPIHRLDFEGHGGRPIPDSGLSMQRFAIEILNWMETNSYAKINIFGYSMGGYAALQLAYLHPEKVNRIATLGTKFAWTPESAATEQQHLIPHVIEAKVPAFASVLAQRHHPQDWKSVVIASANLIHDLGNGAALTEAQFKQITTPTSIGIGLLDRMVTMGESDNVSQWLPNGSFKVFDNFKHPIEKVDVAVLANHLQDFFTNS